MGRGWKGLRKRSTVRFPWTLQRVNVLLEHFWKSSPSSAAEFRAELLCSIPGCLKQSYFRLWPATAERGRAVHSISPAQGSLCLCTPSLCEPSEADLSSRNWPRGQRGCCGSVTVHSAGYHTSAQGPQLYCSFTQFGTSEARSQN